jgi:hypothetical protein
MGRRQGVNVFVAFDECEIGWAGMVDGGDIPDQVRQPRRIAGFGSSQRNDFGNGQT